jgi:hypothetical protein
MPSPLDTDDEAQLVRRARWGQEAAFAELYRRHARAIHALALRLTGNASTVDSHEGRSTMSAPCGRQDVHQPSRIAGSNAGACT